MKIHAVHPKEFLYRLRGSARDSLRKLSPPSKSSTASVFEQMEQRNAITNALLSPPERLEETFVADSPERVDDSFSASPYEMSGTSSSPKFTPVKAIGGGMSGLLGRRVDSAGRRSPTGAGRPIVRCDAGRGASGGVVVVVVLVVLVVVLVLLVVLLLVLLLTDGRGAAGPQVAGSAGPQRAGAALDLVEQDLVAQDFLNQSDPHNSTPRTSPASGRRRSRARSRTGTNLVDLARIFLRGIFAPARLVDRRDPAVHRRRVRSAAALENQQ